MSLQTCPHPSISSRNCLSCGIYIHNQLNVIGLKSHSQPSPPFYSIKNLKKHPPLTPISPSFILNSQIKQIFNILTSRLTICPSTYALAVYLLQSHSPQLIDCQKNPSSSDSLKLIAIACFLLATKTLQIKYKIPRISDIQKILRVQIDKKQVRRIQSVMLCKMTSIATFLDYLEVYKVNGVLFSSENIRYVELVEKKMEEIGWGLVREGRFLEWAQEELAGYVLYRARREASVENAWNEHIEYYTGINREVIEGIVEKIQRKEVMKTNPTIVNVRQIRNGNIQLRQESAKQNKRFSMLDIEKSLQKIRKSYNKLRKETLSPIPKLPSVKSTSGINGRCFRVE